MNTGNQKTIQQEPHSLLLVTNHFPYNTGETFIESEIPFLTAAFDKVLVVAREKDPKSIRPNKGDFGFYRVSPKSSFSEKLMVPWFLFSKLRTVMQLIKAERNGLKATGKKITAQMRKTCRHDLLKALVTAHHIESIMQVNKLHGKVILYSYWMNTSALAVALVKTKKASLTVISRGHGSDIYEYLHPTGYLGFRYALTQKLDAIFTISDFGKTHLSKFLAANEPNTIFVSRLGTFSIVLKEQQSKATFTIVSCSNIIPLKRLHYIIEALEKIHDLQITWVHLGDGPERKKIEDLAREKLAHKTNINYQFTGHVSNQEIKDFYSATHVDLFVNSSYTEGIPVSIMEALSCGIPAIGFNVGGMAEIIQNDHGRILPADNGPYELAATLKELMCMDAAQTQMMREKARIFWKKNYSAEDNYRNFTQTLLGL